MSEQKPSQASIAGMIGDAVDLAQQLAKALEALANAGVDVSQDAINSALDHVHGAVDDLQKAAGT